MQKKKMSFVSIYYDLQRLMTNIQKYAKEKDMLLHRNPHSSYYRYFYIIYINN